MRLKQDLQFDPTLSLTLLLLLVIGLIMVTSSTLFVAEHQYNNALFFMQRHSIHLCIGSMAFIFGYFIPTKTIAYGRVAALLFCYVSLLLVLVPGVGLSINGASRWLHTPYGTIQPSELVKLGFIIFTASYCAKKKSRQRSLDNFDAFRLAGLLLGVDILLCVQPDFGSCIVLSGVVLQMLFVAGLPLLSWLSLASIAGILATTAALLKPYRLLRLATFMDPWSVAFSAGYQLTQSLIAIGRGGIWGVGIGNGLQKIFYLPEAHTDFIFAIICEEFGVIGGSAIIILYVILVVRMLQWSYQFAKNGQEFYALYTVGIASWIGLQVCIGSGVNMGLLPTKGLGLPLVSYGGTHLITVMLSLGVFYRMLRSEVHSRALRQNTQRVAFV